MTRAAVTCLRLVPGLGLDEAAWRPTLHALPDIDLEDVAVVRLPGYGRRTARQVDLSPGALADLLLLSAVPPRGRAVLVGHSASCQVVVEAALRRPDLVAGLVLIGPTTDPRARNWPSLAARWLATARHEAPTQVPTLLRQYARTGLATMARAMESARRHDVVGGLRETTCPLLVVRGVHDRICPDDWAASLAAASGDARSGSTSLPAGAHMVPLTHGPLVAAEIARFLAELG